MPLEIIISIFATLALCAAGFFLYSRSNKPAPQQELSQTLELLQQSLQNNLQANLQSNLKLILDQLNNQQRSQEHQTGQVNNQLQATTRVISDLQTKLNAIEQTNKHLLEMGKDVRQLQNILQAPKLRGNRGEIWLEELIAQMIPKERYKTQYAFKSGEKCDAVILLRDGLILPIDSKFSLENFSKMLATEDEPEKKAHEKLFVSDVKRRIDEIAKKYILPDEGTLSFAFMYVPAENVYYQAFIEDSGGNQLLRYAFERHIIPVSPNSLYAHLEVVLFGLRGMAIEQSAREIQQGLIGLGGELKRFEEHYDKVGNNLRLAQQNFDASDKRLLGVRNKLGSLSKEALGTGEETPIAVIEAE